MFKADTYDQLTGAFMKDWAAVVRKIVTEDGHVSNHTGMLSTAELPWDKASIASDPIGALKAKYQGHVWSASFNGTLVAFALDQSQRALLMFVIDADGNAFYVTDTQDHPSTIFKSPDPCKD